MNGRPLSGRRFGGQNDRLGGGCSHLVNGQLPTLLCLSWDFCGLPVADMAGPAVRCPNMSALLDEPERLLSGARIGIADVPGRELACQLCALFRPFTGSLQFARSQVR